MKEIELKAIDFEVVMIGDGNYGCSFFQYKFTKDDKRYILCLEPCLNGYDIAIYNSDEELMCEKKCTNAINPLFMPDVMLMVSKYLKRFLRSEYE